MQAKLPVCLGFVDYHKRQIGLGPIISPSGNIEEDFVIIRQFYSDKIGKYPHLQSDIAIRPKEAKLHSKGNK